MAQINFYKNITIPVLLLLCYCCSPHSASAIKLLDYSKTQIKIGYNIGKYYNHLSGPEIYTYRANNGFNFGSKQPLELKSKFGNINNFNGLAFCLDFENDESVVTIGWNMRKRVTDYEYTYTQGGNTILTYHERVKLSSNALFFGMGYRPERLDHKFQIGAGFDFGILKTRIKMAETGDIKKEKWQPWFFVPKILKEGYTGNTPIAGINIYTSYDVGPVTLKISRMMPVINGNLLSETGKYTNIPWSDKVIPIGNNMISIMYNFSRKD